MIGKYCEEKGKNEGFPSFKEILDLLVESEYTSSPEIDTLIDKFEKKAKKKSQGRKSMNHHRSKIFTSKEKGEKNVKS